MTPIKNSVRVTAIVVSAVYTGVLFLSGIELDSLTKQALAYLPTAAAVGVVVYDKWVWRWKVVQRIHDRPRIDGIWRATLITTPGSQIPDGGNRGPIRAYVVIEQTYWTISVALLTEESASYSRTARFLNNGQSSQRTLSWLYDNVPRQEHRARSPRHVGAAELNTPQGDVVTMDGSYFTDRFTQGEMTLEFVGRKTDFVDFKAAERHADPS